MTLTLTFPVIAWSIGLFFAWTGVLLGAIKWLLNRQIAAYEARLASAEKKADEAAAGFTEHKQTISNTLAKHKESINTALTLHQKSVTGSLAEIRSEVDRKTTCNNHQRMESNDEKLFTRLDQLHGDVRELVGGVKSLAKSIDILNQHHLKE